MSSCLWSMRIWLSYVVCHSLFKVLTTRIRQVDDSICGLASRDIYGRLIQILNKVVEIQPDEKLMTQRPTHQDLAEMIGSSREMVSIIFAELKKVDIFLLIKKESS